MRSDTHSRTSHKNAEWRGRRRSKPAKPMSTRADDSPGMPTGRAAAASFPTHVEARKALQRRRLNVEKMQSAQPALLDSIFLHNEPEAASFAFAPQLFDCQPVLIRNQSRMLNA